MEEFIQEIQDSTVFAEANSVLEALHPSACAITTDLSSVLELFNACRDAGIPLSMFDGVMKSTQSRLVSLISSLEALEAELESREEYMQLLAAASVHVSAETDAEH